MSMKNIQAETPVKPVRMTQLNGGMVGTNRRNDLTMRPHRPRNDQHNNDNNQTFAMKRTDDTAECQPNHTPERQLDGCITGNVGHLRILMHTKLI